jgi:aryl-alcohol dehydrogenase-like predicted oxidoreductase/histidinol phosphatase-like enzyme/predicted kinase
MDRAIIDAPAIAIGCMRMSTAPDRDDERSVEVLHAAFDAGVTLLDTADAYCLDARDTGHNERLIARALSAWPGDRSRITVATKGGMTRPDGRWEPDGRAKHLAAACERSCAALGVKQIDLYQLHVPDPRVPLATSVRALATLKKNNLVRAIGLCNVTVGQIEEARRITDIAAIQVEMNLWNEASVLGGVAGYCVRHRLPLIAYRPLGGRKSASRLKNDPTLIEIAGRHNATPAEIALAWLRDLSECIVPIPGVTRVESVRSVARAYAIHLTGQDRELLDRHFPAGRTFRVNPAPFDSAQGRKAGLHMAGHHRDGEVVLIMGLPGAGKSKLAHGLAADGYVRLNRDDAGGGLRDLLPALDRELSSERPRVVLDNTYVTRKSRAEVIRAASERGVSVRCLWLTTSVDEAQVNAATRILRKYGRLPEDAELARLRKQDVSAFLPTVQFRYQRELEPPDPSEGFAAIEQVPFLRERDPDHVNRAVIVWLDQAAIEDALAAALRAREKDGWKILGLSWQPGIEAGTTSRAEVDAQFASLRERAGVGIEIEYCPHGAGPPRCWCRKPLPGLGVLLIDRHQLDPAQCIYIGAGSQDPGFARKLGFAYRRNSLDT